LADVLSLNVIALWQSFANREVAADMLLRSWRVR
jgi:hypothetical protein